MQLCMGILLALATSTYTRQLLNDVVLLTLLLPPISQKLLQFLTALSTVPKLSKIFINPLPPLSYIHLLPYIPISFTLLYFVSPCPRARAFRGLPRCGWSCSSLLPHALLLLAMTKADSPKPPTKLETITLKVFIHCEGCRRKVRRIIRVLDGVEDVTVDAASGKVTITGTADAKTIMQRLQKYGKHAEMWPNSTPAPPAAGKAGANQSKPNNNNNGSDSNNKKKSNAGAAEGGDKAAAAAENGSKKGDGKKEATPGAPAKADESAANESKPEKGKEAKPEEASNANAPTQNGGGGGKKGGKKGGNGNNANNSNTNSYSGGGNGNTPEALPFPPPPPVHDIPNMNAPNTSIAVSANKSLAPYDSVQTGYTYHSAEYATHMFSDENANNCSIM